MSDQSTPKAKRGRPRTSLILTCYPPGMHIVLERISMHPDMFHVVRGAEDDDVAIQRNRRELNKELQREKPKKEIILSLARQTYYSRRASVLSEADDVCATSLLCEFPEFRKPYVVSNNQDALFFYCSPTPLLVGTGD